MIVLPIERGVLSVNLFKRRCLMLPVAPVLPCLGLASGSTAGGDSYSLSPCLFLQGPTFYSEQTKLFAFCHSFCYSIAFSITTVVSYYLRNTGTSGSVVKQKFI